MKWAVGASCGLRCAFFVQDSIATLSAALNGVQAEALHPFEADRSQVPHALAVTVRPDHSLEVAERYDRPHTFFYADPPYWETEGYGVSFGWSEYERLAHLMSTCKGRVMFSINDHPAIRELFSCFHCHDLGIKYSNGNQAKGAPVESRELVFTNWDPMENGVLF